MKRWSGGCEWRRRQCCPGDRRVGERGAWASVAALAHVLLHGVIDQVVHGAFELLSHLLKLLPKRIAAVEGAGSFLVWLGCHRQTSCAPVGVLGIAKLSPF